MKIHAYNSHKQINTENAANENKDYKQDTDPTIIIHNRSRIFLASVDRSIHVIWPALQRTQHE